MRWKSRKKISQRMGKRITKWGEKKQNGKPDDERRKCGKNVQEWGMSLENVLNQTIQSINMHFKAKLVSGPMCTQVQKL